MNKLLIIYESESGANPPIHCVINVPDEGTLSAQVMEFFKSHIFGHDSEAVDDVLFSLKHDGYAWVQEKWLLSLNEAVSSL